MIIWNVFSFIFGAAIGSFLNVCIYRIPDNESIIKPLSRCPHCKKPIRFYDNIP
ncbi:MAG: prepilin peptidase, partial [Syntrophaceae bacterium]|nr:prepilin peptidase [Syntrophaceae bacterium]